MRRPGATHPHVQRSAFAGFRFTPEVITVAVRWYLEELLAERGIEVDHVTVFRWVQTFTSEFIDAARPARHATGDRWLVDETYVKVAGHSTYLYRAIDQYGQVIDVLVSTRRNAETARAFFTRALCCATAPVEVTTDRAPVYRAWSRTWSRRSRRQSDNATTPSELVGRHCNPPAERRKEPKSRMWPVLHTIERSVSATTAHRSPAS